ncbi:MAG: phage tail protein, partial [Micavibrio aeruginosavorus]
MQEDRDYTHLLRRYDQAKERRSVWEDTWQECYDYSLPQRGNFTASQMPGRIRTDRLYDGTALDAVDQLAASLLGHLTPPWTQWFGFKPGPDLSAAEAQTLAPVLEESAKIIQAHFDHSNFCVEMHQCFLDLVVGGTAALYFEEAEPGAFSAFK